MLDLDVGQYTDESEKALQFWAEDERDLSFATELPRSEADDATRMEAWRAENVLQDDYEQ